LAFPAFGSSPNLEALALDFNNKSANAGEDTDDSHHSQRYQHQSFVDFGLSSSVFDVSRGFYHS
jgi:hypothetical protein